jgi:undecaprenyl-diphosphatase
MLATLLSQDAVLTTFLSGIIPHLPIFNSLFGFLSLNGLTYIVWILFLGIYLLFKEKRDVTFIIYLSLTFLTTILIVNFALKNVFQRERPYVARHLAEVTCPIDYSFPSGHAATAFAGAVIFAKFDKKRKWFYYGVAFLISFSRIYLYCHYFLDVLFGALIGVGIGMLYLKLLAGRIKIEDVQ